MNGLREAFDEIVADVPVYGDLDRAIEQADRERRRRSLIGAAAASAAAVVVVTAIATGAADRRGADPAPPGPSPSTTQTAGPAASPDPTLPADVARRLREIRDQGSPGSYGAPEPLLRDPASGLKVRLYWLCDGGSCRHSPPSASWPPDGTPRALEVAQDGRSALFDVSPNPRGTDTYDPPHGVNARVFDDDSVLVQDAARVGGEVRYRLLQADGTSFTLRRVLDDPAPALPGPEVLVLDEPLNALGDKDYQSLFLVDDRAATIRPLDVPDDRIHSWQAFGSDLLIGTGPHCRVSWLTGDGLRERQLDCAARGNLAPLGLYREPAGWMQPGRVAAIEWIRNGNLVNEWQFFVHVSLDDGDTWRRIPLGRDPRPERFANVLRRLG